MISNLQLIIPSRRIRLMVWLLFAFIFIWAGIQSPPWMQLQKQLVKASQAEVPFILGKYELAAKDAATQHLSVQFFDEQWQLKNISHDKKLLLLPKQGGELRARQWVLQQGDVFAVGDVFIAIDKTTEVEISIKVSLRKGQSVSWRYSDDRLWRENVLLDNCPDSRFKSRLVSWFNRLPYFDWKVSRPLLLGGNVLCGRFLGLANLPLDTLRIIHDEKNKQFILLPGAELSDLNLPVRLARKGSDLFLAWQQYQMTEFDVLQDLALFPKSGDHLIAGHSFFRLDFSDNEFIFTPVSRTQRHAERKLTAGAKWIESSDFLDFSHFPVKHVFILLVAIMGLGLTSLMLPVRRFGYFGSRKQRLLFCLFSLLALLGLLTWYHAGRMPVAWSLSLIWLAVGSWLLIPWKSSLSSDILILFSVLLGLGLMTQLQLGLGAAESHWIDYLTKTAGLSAFFLWATRAMYVYREQLRQIFVGLNANIVAKLYWIMLTFTMFFLAFQWVAGSEGGVAGVQPVEFAKLMMISFAAYCLALYRRRQTWSLAEWRKKIILIAIVPVLFSFVLVGFAMIMLRDFSPLILLFVWFFGLTFAYQSTEKNVLGQRVLLGLLFACIVGIYAIHENSNMVSFLAQSERISTWAEPELYPHSGYQVGRAIEAIYQGGWLGVGSIFSFSPVLTDVISIPAIQDDFAPSLFLHHFGIVAAVGLLLVQLLLLSCLVKVAFHFYQVLVVQGKGDHLKMLFGWFMFYFVTGGVAMLAGHFLISWATNTALLPVMGQPIPFISAAGSHLLFFVFPLLFISLWVEEELIDEG